MEEGECEFCVREEKNVNPEGKINIKREEKRLTKNEKVILCFWLTSKEKRNIDFSFCMKQLEVEI